MSSYEYWTHFAATYGSIYFGLMFLLVLIYALRPSNKETFDHAARLPLNED
jgi:cytochrome c oxidase cbb3-type subunit 4